MPVADYVLIEVTDSGTGMSPDVLLKVFEPFFTTKEIGKGSGLGLSQVLGFVQQSGGGVKIASSPGHGTSVEVYIPRATEQPVDDIDEDDEAVLSAMASSPLVLAVDDDNAVREVTIEMLSMCGFDVIGAHCGERAIELARERRFDIALIDVAMPDMNGVEVAQAIREIQPKLPVLFVTGFADLGILRAIDEDRIVPKPVQSDKLAAKIRQFLHRDC